MSAAKSKSERRLVNEAVRSFVSFPNLVLGCTYIDTLSSTRIFFSDGDLNKSRRSYELKV